jgi:hypothetical protein
MTPEEYMERRVEDQIRWYDKKSQSAQSWFKRIRAAEIVLAAAIPVLATFTDTSVAAQVTIGLLGAGVVVLASFLSLNQYQENWIQYRTSCEALKYEKFLFLTKTEPYDSGAPYPLFVDRIESRILQENGAWSLHARSDQPTK